MNPESKKKIDDIVGINLLTEKIIGCAFKVCNSLGAGFLEKVYENALAHELEKSGLHVIQQQNLTVWYDGIVVGDFAADLVVDEQILVELKSLKALNDSHMAQCINYLKATKLKICLLINFGNSKMEFKRIIN
ncbi:MAG: GxxExxY protein [Anaerolineaceae bacterium]|jgi:GxxExxY protein